MFSIGNREIIFTEQLTALHVTYPIFPASSRSWQYVSPKPTDHQSTQEFLRGTLDSVASREGRPPFHSVKMNGWTRGCQDEKGMGTMQRQRASFPKNQQTSTTCTAATQEKCDGNAAKKTKDHPTNQVYFNNKWLKTAVHATGIAPKSKIDQCFLFFFL